MSIEQIGKHSVLWQQAVGSGTPTIFKAEKDREYLDVGGNTLFLYESSVNELTQLLRILMLSPNLLDYMHKASLTKGIEVFSYESITAKLLKSWGGNIDVLE